MAAWQRWAPAGTPDEAEGLYTTSVAVGGADTWWRPYHDSPDPKKRKDRMPRILLPEAAEQWMDPDRTERLVAPDSKRAQCATMLVH